MTRSLGRPWGVCGLTTSTTCSVCVCECVLGECPYVGKIFPPNENSHGVPKPRGTLPRPVHARTRALPRLYHPRSAPRGLPSGLTMHEVISLDPMLPPTLPLDNVADYNGLFASCIGLAVAVGEVQQFGIVYCQRVAIREPTDLEAEGVMRTGCRTSASARRDAPGPASRRGAANLCVAGAQCAPELWPLHALHHAGISALGHRPQWFCDDVQPAGGLVADVNACMHACMLHATSFQIRTSAFSAAQHARDPCT
jgi:hypothetical protein